MKLSLVVPVFNEEQAVGLFYQAVRQEPSLQPYCVEIVFVNDGSTIVRLTMPQRSPWPIPMCY